MSDTMEDSIIVPPKPPPKKVGRKKVSRRKLVKRPKARGRYKAKGDKSGKQLTKNVAECIFSDEEERNDSVVEMGGNSDASSISILQPSSKALGNTSTDIQDLASVVASDPSATLNSSCTSRPSSSMSRPGVSLNSSLLDAAVPEPEEVNGVPALPDVNPPVELVRCAIDRLMAILPACWKIIGDKFGIHFLLISLKCPQAIQREVCVSFGGNVLVYVHCVLVPSFQTLFDLKSTPSVPLREDTLKQFCEYCVFVARQFFQYNVCVGANDSEIISVWNEIDGGYIDWNPYQEDSYEQTFRSNSCARLVPAFKVKRCKHCASLLKSIQRRKHFLLAPSADPFTSNKHLTREQCKKKMEEQEKTIRKRDKQIVYLRSRFKKILESEGVNINEEMNNLFSQDPLEQELSKQGAGADRNCNPNAKAFQSKMVVLDVHRDIGIKSKMGNGTDKGGSAMKLSDEPVRKRARTSKKK